MDSIEQKLQDARNARAFETTTSHQEGLRLAKLLGQTALSKRMVSVLRTQLQFKNKERAAYRLASADGSALWLFALDGFSDLLNQVLDKGQEVFQSLETAFFAQSIDEIRNGQWKHRGASFGPRE